MPPKPKSKFGPQEAKLAAYAAPFVLLALLVVLVLVNVKHSMLCEQGGESAAEAMLKRQALEKRFLSLEQETLQNNILFEKFIRRLDEQFQITKNIDLTSIKNLAHADALSISARLQEENAPPMPSFSELYNDPSSLNDAIDNAMGALDDQFGYGGEMKSLDDKYGGGNFGNQMEFVEGQDDKYGNQEYKDDFNKVGDDKYGSQERQKISVPPEEAKAQCSEWKQTYNVAPGINWGSLPFDLQETWKDYDCDLYVTAW